MKKDQTIVICSSAAFYKQVNDVAEQLNRSGYEDVVVQKTANAMKLANNYDVSSYKTWKKDDTDYDKKADFMRTHFDSISEGDAILVINNEKNGIANYIGPNVLMEMSLAWYLNKPIYLLNPLPENSPYEEELKGMFPIILDGNLTDIDK